MIQYLSESQPFYWKRSKPLLDVYLVEKLKTYQSLFQLYQSFSFLSGSSSPPELSTTKKFGAIKHLLKFHDIILNLFPHVCYHISTECFFVFLCFFVVLLLNLCLQITSSYHNPSVEDVLVSCLSSLRLCQYRQLLVLIFHLYRCFHVFFC